MNRTAKALDKITKPGRYCFGHGLWLTISKTGGKAWSYRFTINGHARAMGLGGMPSLSLEQARSKAVEARKLARSGIDPIEARRAKAIGRNGHSMSLRAVADALIADLRHGWKSPKSEQQWRQSLADFVYPTTRKSTPSGCVVR